MLGTPFGFLCSSISQIFLKSTEFVLLRRWLRSFFRTTWSDNRTGQRTYRGRRESDSETIAPSQRRVLKDRIDRQYMGRLERLLPLRRSIQKSAAKV
jgi:hypothetical protein